MSLNVLSDALAARLFRYRQAAVEGDESAEAAAFREIVDLFGMVQAGLVHANAAAGRCPSCAVNPVLN